MISDERARELANAVRLARARVKDAEQAYMKSRRRKNFLNRGKRNAWSSDTPEEKALSKTRQALSDSVDEFQKAFNVEINRAVEKAAVELQVKFDMTGQELDDAVWFWEDTKQRDYDKN